MTDTAQKINCPACGCEMEKIYLQDAGISIDICTNGCGGLFFDNQELQTINASEKDINEVKKALNGKTFKAVDSAQTRVCPVCGTKMVKTKAFGTEIDTCYNCGAVFLDANEIDTVKLKRHESAPMPASTENEQIEGISLKEFYADAQQEELAEDWRDEEIERSGPLGFIRSLFRI